MLTSALRLSWVRRGIEPEQRLRVGVTHRAEDLLGRAGLDDPARVHDADPVSASRDHAHVVGDEQRRHPKAILEIVEQREDLRLDRHVQSRCRLVGEQHFRLAGERDRDHHPLAQPARELVGVVAEPLARLGEPDQLEHLERSLARLLARQRRGAGEQVPRPGRRSSSSGSARRASPGRSSRSRCLGSSGARGRANRPARARQAGPSLRSSRHPSAAGRGSTARASTSRSPTRPPGRASRRCRSRCRRFRRHGRSNA